MPVDYIVEQQVPMLISEFIEKLLEARPADPVSFLVSVLATKQGKRNAGAS